VVIVWMVLGPLMEPKREKKVVAIIPNAFFDIAAIVLIASYSAPFFYDPLLHL
jgi:hypothetical protein